jgi:hypothetical protein
MSTTTASQPDFRSPDFLRAHIRQTMAFYDPVATDASGGMYHFFLDDGTVYDTRTRHLVSATRFVVTHAMLYRTTGEPRYQAARRRDDQVQCAKNVREGGARRVLPALWRFRERGSQAETVSPSAIARGHPKNSGKSDEMPRASITPWC